MGVREGRIVRERASEREKERGMRKRREEEGGKVEWER